ncbi:MULTISPECIES: DUF1707 domain-containing protein [unclassified Streptomyces]|uniref:DUF1707 SHOCT-like domain-containing protein n=1 Tax=unclassified Streptomyces TaxID=2593676 RepID=UPI0037FC6F73
MTDDAVPDLRASDDDRDRVAEILRDAVAEGRLDMAEFDERLEATYRARTYGELAPLIRDLPVSGGPLPPSLPVSLVKEPLALGGWAGRVVGDRGAAPWAVAVLSGFQRKGRWTMPKRLNCFAFWGGGEIDLREADFADREVQINCVAIMGGVNVVVPPGVEVVMRGVGLMGGFDSSEEGVPGDPGAPRVTVTGFAFWGGVGVERKVTKAERRRLKEERQLLKEERRRAGLESGAPMRGRPDTGTGSDGSDGGRRALEGRSGGQAHERREERRERHEERRARHEERRERHRERRERRGRRRNGEYGEH